MHAPSFLVEIEDREIVEFDLVDVYLTFPPK